MFNKNGDPYDWETLCGIANFLYHENFIEEIAKLPVMCGIIYEEGTYKIVRKGRSDCLNIDIYTKAELRNSILNCSMGIKNPAHLFTLKNICSIVKEDEKKHRSKEVPKLPVYKIIGYLDGCDERHHRERELLRAGYKTSRRKTTLELEVEGKRILVEDFELNYGFMRKYVPLVKMITLSIELGHWEHLHNWRYIINKKTLRHEMDGKSITEDDVKKLYIKEGVNKRILDLLDTERDEIIFETPKKRVIYNARKIRDKIAPYREQSS